MRGFDQLTFDNRFVAELPADGESRNVPRQVSAACYSFVQPTPVGAPQTVAYSREVADLLGLTVEECQSKAFAQLFAGNELLSGMQPYACCYGGHQFGHWAGQLGDGRAINLGEIVNQQGQRWALQLKGAGLTPYSRRADGLAVMRSSVREFLCSEAMFHLGVPTTRALSLVATGEQVQRDMFYDGNAAFEPGAIVCRVAPSFTRFGSFQIHAARKDYKLLKQLLDYTIRYDFPHLGEPSVATYLLWFEEVCARTVEMIVQWQRVGFVHGVMNTDNMSVLGLTIDYGPYGWLEPYDPEWTPNTTDTEGRRYRFGNQPQIAMWNLAQLANAILPLIEDVEALQSQMKRSAASYQQQWLQMMGNKLGLSDIQAEDASLINELLTILALIETDMTIFFRRLADVDQGLGDEQLIAPLLDAYYDLSDLDQTYRERLDNWIRMYQQRLSLEARSDAERIKAMNRVNPKYVLRNYLAQQAIDLAESGDGSKVMELLQLLRHPYDEQPDFEHLAVKRPEWARHKAGCSMLSCSS